MLGGLRSIAQTISYEVCIIFILIFYIFIILRFNLVDYYIFQKNINFFYINVIIAFVIFIIFLAETNRAPFDFAEGESELVSGFNTEYRRGSFAIIFLAEYTRILFLRFVFVLLFFRSNIYLIFFLKIVVVRFLFIWVRGAFPRFRYDKLIYLSWKVYLSLSLLYLIMIVLIKIFIM